MAGEESREGCFGEDDELDFFRGSFAEESDESLHCLPLVCIDMDGADLRGGYDDFSGHCSGALFVFLFGVFVRVRTLVSAMNATLVELCYMFQRCYDAVVPKRMTRAGRFWPAYVESCMYPSVKRPILPGLSEGDEGS